MKKIDLKSKNLDTKSLLIALSCCAILPLLFSLINNNTGIVGYRTNLPGETHLRTSDTIAVFVAEYDWNVDMEVDFTFTGSINYIYVIMVWDFGDSNSLTGDSHSYVINGTYFERIPNEEILNPKHTYESGGIYIVTLTLIEPYSQSFLDLFTGQIEIAEPQEFPATPAILIVMIAGFICVSVFFGKKVHNSKLKERK